MLTGWQRLALEAWMLNRKKSSKCCGMKAVEDGPAWHPVDAASSYSGATTASGYESSVSCTKAHCEIQDKTDTQPCSTGSAMRRG
eukprot:779845-Amphidinium_carterae.1